MMLIVVNGWKECKVLQIGVGGAWLESMAH